MSEKNNNDNVLGIIALVCGIAGIVFSFVIPVLNLGLAVAAIICGLIGRSQGQKYATAGFILGLVTILMSVLIIIAGIAFFSSFVEEMHEFSPNIRRR